MKKAIYLLAATALMASCNEDVLVDSNDQQTEVSSPIGFDTFVDKATRAQGTNSNNLQDFYPSFNVYGWKTVGGTTSSVFNNIEVSYYNAEEGTGVKPSTEWGVAQTGWYYENIRYWDKLADSYQFSAYAPVGASKEVKCTADGTITIGTAASPITVDGMNLMATPAKQLAFTGFKYDYMTAQANDVIGNVHLTFHHLLAKLNIRVRLSDAVQTAQDVAIQKIEVHNLSDVAYYVNDDKIGVSGWTVTAPSDAYVPTVAKTYSLNATENFNDYYVMEQLIIPQTILNEKGSILSINEYKEACIYVEYTIGKETFKLYTPLAYIFANDVERYSFQGGMQYTINVHVGPSPITFTAEVAEWEDAVEKDNTIR